MLNYQRVAWYNSITVYTCIYGIFSIGGFFSSDPPTHHGFSKAYSNCRPGWWLVPPSAENPLLLGFLWNIKLVGGMTYPSEEYDFVSWNDDIPNIWNHKNHVPNHQPVNHSSLKPDILIILLFPLLINHRLTIDQPDSSHFPHGPHHICPISGACHFGRQTARVRRRQRTRQLTVAQELPQAWETGENCWENRGIFQVFLQVFNLKHHTHMYIYIYIYIYGLKLI